MLILIFTFRLEIINWITIEAGFLLHIQSGSLDYRYLFISMAFLILLTNIIILRILSIGQCFSIKKAKSQKPDF